MAVIIIECHPTEEPSSLVKLPQENYNFLPVDFLDSSTTTGIVFHDFNLKGQQDRQVVLLLKCCWKLDYLIE